MKKIVPMELIVLLALMWVGYLLSWVTPVNNLGIYPRSIDGLIGLPLSAFLHGGFMHIVCNSFGLIICGLILKLRFNSQQMQWLLVIGILSSGLGTWLISSPANVIGASGLVFFMLGLLAANAFFNPSLITILQAGLCLFFYGGAFLSLLYFQRGVSWAGHFSGLVMGVGMAYYLKSFPWKSR